ncbi:MAG: Ig-like domain repeat protein [Leucobacter sp.]
MKQSSAFWRRRGAAAIGAISCLALIAQPVAAQAAEPGDWTVTTASHDSGVKNGYQLAGAGNSIYVTDAQWRAESKLVGTPENTPLESGTSMRTTFSPYGIAVDPDVNGERVIVTTTARQRDAAAGYGGGVVVYKESQGAPTDADRIFANQDGTPIFSGVRRAAVHDASNRAFITNLGNSRGSGPDGFISVIDLTKRGAEAVIAQVTVPGAWGAVGVDVDQNTGNIYVGTMTGEKLYVIDSSKITASGAKDFAANNGAITELAASVGANARPTYNEQLKKVFVSAFDDSKITVVDGDPASATYGQVEKVIDVTVSGSGARGTNAVEVDAERGLLYSANLDSGVTVYDINDDYKQLEFTAEDGSTFSDIPTSGRAVNFGLNPENGQVWVSMQGSSGKVDVLDLQQQTATKTFTSLQDPNATVTYAGDWKAGEKLTVTGKGWTSKAGKGSRIGVKLDRGKTERKQFIAEPEEVLEDVWAVVDANDDGTFTAELEFPTDENSTLTGNPPAPAWTEGNEHEISFLSGSLGLGTDRESIARGGVSKVTVASAGAQGDWTVKSNAYDTGVKNGYQLAFDGGNVYVPDAQWTTAAAIGTGKVAVLNGANGEKIADHDYTQLRRNDGIVMPQGRVTTEPSGKVVTFDATSKAQTGTHSFLDLSRNDGTGKEGDAFEWSASDTANSKTSMRSTFSPYGVAVDPDVNGEATIITTTARQRDAAAGYGGGVVVYKESQGAPTDADRIFANEDGAPIFSGVRRVAVNDAKNLAFVTNLGNSRGSGPDGFITVIDLPKRGADSVVAQVTVPDAKGAVGVDVDEANDKIYVGSMVGEKLYVIDGSKIKSTGAADFTSNNDAITELDAAVGANARPTVNEDLKKVFVSAFDDSKITVVNGDPTSADFGKAEKVIDVAVEGSGARGTNAVEVDAERGLLYSANLDSGVTVYDINDDYAQLELTAADGSTVKDIATSGRAVNFALNEATGEVWVSMQGSAGKVDTISLQKAEEPDPEPAATKSAVSFGTKSFAYNKAATATVKVTSSEGTPKGQVSLRINGKTYKAKLNSKGVAKVKLTKAVNPGKRKVTVSYAGADGFEKSSASTTVTVTKATPKVSAKLAKSKVKTSQNATVKVAVTVPGSLKAKASQVKVEVFDGSKKIKTATLNKAGKANVKLPKLKQGTHKIRVKVAGNSKLKAKYSTYKTLKVVK